jgi:hypothetical protein
MTVFKKDPIFWYASAIFVIALALFVITKQQSCLLLMIGAYLLRPVLASLGPGRKYVDERQLSIHYRSGNIGFAVLLIVCAIFGVKLEFEGNHAFEYFYSAIIIGLAAKALFNVVLVKNFRENASKIIMAVGLLVALFSILDVKSPLGMLISALPGLVIAAIGMLAPKYPRVIGIIIVVLAIAAMIFILSFKKGWGQIVTAAVIGIPLLIAGIGLFFSGQNSDVTDTAPVN